jgi:hypothetical protein
MALFTTADRDAVKAAMVELAVSGVASVSVGGQTVTATSLDQLRKLLEMIQGELAEPETGFGMRMVKTIPPGAG